MATTLRTRGVRLSDEDYEELERQAKREGRTASNLMRWIIKQYIEGRAAETAA